MFSKSQFITKNYKFLFKKSDINKILNNNNHHHLILNNPPTLPPNPNSNIPLTIKLFYHLLPLSILSLPNTHGSTTPFDNRRSPTSYATVLLRYHRSTLHHRYIVRDHIAPTPPLSLAPLLCYHCLALHHYHVVPNHIAPTPPLSHAPPLPCCVATTHLAPIPISTCMLNVLIWLCESMFFYLSFESIGRGLCG